MPANSDIPPVVPTFGEMFRPDDEIGDPPDRTYIPPVGGVFVRRLTDTDTLLRASIVSLRNDASKAWDQPSAYPVTAQAARGLFIACRQIRTERANHLAFAQQMFIQRGRRQIQELAGHRVQFDINTLNDGVLVPTMDDLARFALANI